MEKQKDRRAWRSATVKGYQPNVVVRCSYYNITK